MYTTISQYDFIKHVVNQNLVIKENKMLLDFYFVHGNNGDDQYGSITK
jgi:hypothetical protein